MSNNTLKRLQLQLRIPLFTYSEDSNEDSDQDPESDSDEGSNEDAEDEERRKDRWFGISFLINFLERFKLLKYLEIICTSLISFVSNRSGPQTVVLTDGDSSFQRLQIPRGVDFVRLIQEAIKFTGGKISHVKCRPGVDPGVDSVDELNC